MSTDGNCDYPTGDCLLGAEIATLKTGWNQAAKFWEADRLRWAREERQLREVLEKVKTQVTARQTPDADKLQAAWETCIEALK